MTKSSSNRPKPELSIVIPVVERHDNLEQLFAEYSEQINQLGLRAEYIFVIDYRERETLPGLRALQEQAEEEITLITFGGAFGESSALTVGLRHARGRLIATAASYFQVEPSGIKTALDKIGEGFDLVVASRSPRTDSFFNRVQTLLFHGLVNMFSPRRFNDISCGFRVMNRSVAEELEIYGGLHRFIPILAVHAGFKVHEISLPQRKEDAPTRFHGVAVYFKRVLDVMTLFFLMKFTRRPLRFFGLIGLALAAAGTAITAYLGVYRLFHLGPIAGRPLLLLGVLLVVLGIQTLSLGLIGEIIIFTHARKIRDYRVEAIIRSGESTPPEPVTAHRS